MAIKLCVDCKHISHDGLSTSSSLLCGRAQRQNPVDGKMSFLYCEVMRMSGQPCGLNATLFEKKE